MKLFVNREDFVMRCTPALQVFKLAALALAAVFSMSAQAQFQTNGSLTGVPAATYSSTYTGAQTNANSSGTVLTSGANTISNWYGGSGTTAVVGGTGNTLTLNEGEVIALKLNPISTTGITGGFNHYTLSFSYLGTNNSGPTNSAAFTDTTIGVWKLVTGSDTSPFSNPSAAAATSNTSFLSDALTGSLRNDGTTVGAVSNAFAAGETGVQLGGTITEGAGVGNFSFILPTQATNYSSLWLVFEAYDNGNNGAVSSLTIDNVSAVPEPESGALIAAGIGALAFMSRRRRVSQG